MSSEEQPRRREATKNVNYNEREVDAELAKRIQILEKVAMNPGAAIAKARKIAEAPVAYLVGMRSLSTKNSFMIKIPAGILFLHYLLRLEKIVGFQTYWIWTMP